MTSDPLTDLEALKGVGDFAGLVVEFYQALRRGGFGHEDAMRLTDTWTSVMTSNVRTGE